MSKKTKKTLLEKHREKFEILRHNFQNDHVMLVESQLKETGKKVIVLCAYDFDYHTDEFVLLPMAILIDGDPNEILGPPK